jgi:hypothetical protein
MPAAWLASPPDVGAYNRHELMRSIPNPRTARGKALADQFYAHFKGSATGLSCHSPDSGEHDWRKFKPEKDFF